MCDVFDRFVKENIDKENKLSNAGSYIIKCIYGGKTKVISNNGYTKIIIGDYFIEMPERFLEKFGYNVLFRQITRGINDKDIK